LSLEEIHAREGDGRSSSGQALVVVLLLVVLVVVTAQIVIVPAFYSMRASRRTGAQNAAGNVNDAVVDFAMAALNTTVPSNNATQLQMLPAYFTAVDSTTWRYDDAGNGNIFGDMFPEAAVNLTISVPAQIPVPNGSDRAADYRIIRTTCALRGVQRRLVAIAKMNHAHVRGMAPVFTRAITSRGDVTTQGVGSTLRTDSYDSADGLYGAANVGYEGGVHTNGSLVNGGVYRGNVTVAGTSNGGVTVEGPGNILDVPADTEDIPDAPAAPTTTVSPAWSCPGTVTPPGGQIAALGAVNLSGNASNVLTLSAGTYVCSSLAISGSASLLIPGPGEVTLYVTGNVDVAGNGIVNGTQLPANLKVIATGPGTANLAGNGNFYGLFLAPSRTMTIGGNGEVYGSLVVQSVLLSGAHAVVHYDDAAADAMMQERWINKPSEYRVLALDYKNRLDP
jgi:hypothetical protein